jgi:rhamnosyltransferase subunit B
VTDSGRSRRVVFATFGSLGDLHPYMAIALEWQRRGHDAVIATSKLYRDKVEREGIGFAAIRPDLSDLGDQAEVLKKVFDIRRGPEFMIREVMMRHLRASYEDMSAAARGADLVVSHVLTFSAPVVAEKLRIPWAGSALAPLSFFSAFDPPVLPPVPAMARLRGLGAAFHRPLFGLMKAITRSWTQPVHALRKEMGLTGSGQDPMYEGQYSPTLNLALFSPVFGPPQPDWPAKTVVTGFPFYDRQESDGGMPRGLLDFLDAGPAPIVFTLGSSAVMDAGRFYAESAEAARKLGSRAVLLIGNDPRNVPAEPLPEGVAAFQYAPYSGLFPRAAAIVHQGGVGTTAQALRAGRPMVVVPFGFDQPDNAARVGRLGISRTIRRARYDGGSVAAALQQLLADDAVEKRAGEIGRQVRSESGAESACDAIERVLR